jgi:cysteinyl-tRNA synthetase
MDDDLNTPGALAAVFDFVRAGNTILEGGNAPGGDRSAMASFMDRLVTGILGIRLEPEAGGSSEDLCRILGEARGYLRKNRLFEEADRMRDELAKAGYAVRDLPGSISEVAPEI